MSYQEQNDLYRDVEQRGRLEICTREQGLIFANDGRPDIASLGRGVTAGDMQDIDAVIAGVCVGPNYATVGDDQALLSAVQGVWPAVAAARYPGTA